MCILKTFTKVDTNYKKYNSKSSKLKLRFRKLTYWSLNFYNFYIQYQQYSNEQFLLWFLFSLNFFTSSKNFNLWQSDFWEHCRNWLNSRFKKYQIDDIRCKEVQILLLEFLYTCSKAIDIKLFDRLQLHQIHHIYRGFINIVGKIISRPLKIIVAYKTFDFEIKSQFSFHHPITIPIALWIQGDHTIKTNGIQLKLIKHVSFSHQTHTVKRKSLKPQK